MVVELQSHCWTRDLETVTFCRKEIKKERDSKRPFIIFY